MFLFKERGGHFAYLYLPKQDQLFYWEQLLLVFIKALKSPKMVYFSSTWNVRNLRGRCSQSRVPKEDELGTPLSLTVREGSSSKIRREVGGSSDGDGIVMLNTPRSLVKRTFSTLVSRKIKQNSTT